MKLTKSQREILALADRSGRITKTRCIDAFADRYYIDEQKYIGERLAAMVRAGILKKTKRFWYIKNNTT